MRLVILTAFSLLALQTMACAQNAYPGGGAPTGTAGIPAGKYVLTNVESGRSSYLIISAGGDVYVQAGPSVQPTVAPQQPLSKYGVMSGLLNRSAGPQQGWGGNPPYGAPVGAGYAQQTPNNQAYSQPSGYQPQGVPAYPQQSGYGPTPYGQPPGTSPVFGLPPDKQGYSQ
jgi:hypothetical protein